MNQKATINLEHTCSTLQALATLNRIDGVVAVLHANRSCSFCMQIGSFSCAKAGFPVLVSTEIEAKDLIFGAEKKLKKTILDVFERVCPQAIVVLNTCTAQINNEDIEGCLSALRKQIPCVLSFCNTGCNILGSQSAGNDFAWQALLKQITPTDKKIKAIGLLGRSGMDTGSLSGIEAILDNSGIGYFSFPQKTFQETHKITLVKDIFVLSPVPYFSCKTLKDRFGVNCHYGEVPAGIEATTKFLLLLAEHTKSKKLIDVVKKEKAKILPKAGLLKSKLRAKRPNVLCAYGPGNEFSIAKILAEFGANVFLLTQLDNEFAKKEKMILNDRYGVNVLDDSPADIQQIIEENKINAVFTEIQFPRKLISNRPIFYNMFYSGEYGYGFAINFVENFLRCINNKAYYQWGKINERYR